MVTAPALPAGPWAPLARPAFRAIWIASLVGNLGTWMQTVGAQWLLVDGGSGSALVALVQSASSLPVLLLTLPAGRGRRVRRPAPDAARGPALPAAGGRRAGGADRTSGRRARRCCWPFTFLLGCGAAAQMPAYQAFVPDLVPRASSGRPRRWARSRSTSRGPWARRSPGALVAPARGGRALRAERAELHRLRRGAAAGALAARGRPGPARRSSPGSRRAAATCATPRGCAASWCGCWCSPRPRTCCGRCWPSSPTTGWGSARPATGCCSGAAGVGSVAGALLLPAGAAPGVAAPASCSARASSRGCRCWSWAPPARPSSCSSRCCPPGSRGSR